MIGQCLLLNEQVNGKTFMTIKDKKSTHEDMPYKSFTNLCSYVDNYRLLQLADLYTTTVIKMNIWNLVKH